jgi:bifunctional DNase/RNase
VRHIISASLDCNTLFRENETRFVPVRRRSALLVFSLQADTLLAMNKSVVEVNVRAVLPTNAGRAVFVGNDEKVFVIYVDEGVGAAITMFMSNTPKERPLTHDLMGHLMQALGAKVDRVIINDLKTSTYFARLIISAENELQQKKIIELDARPSDCIALATSQKAPIYVSKEVWDEVDDMSDVLKSMSEGGLQSEEGEQGEPEK